MKAILFDRNINDPIPNPVGLTLISDSAITIAGRPVFLPDFDSQWSAEFYLALKVCRLGKCISEKFAHRYYDRFTVAMRLVPVNVTAELRSQGLPTAIGDIFDNALTLGSWIETPDIAESFNITANEDSVSINNLKQIADEAIATVSRYTTLKTGDVIMIGRTTETIIVDRGQQITTNLDGKECFALKIH